MADRPIRILHVVSSLNRRGAELSAIRLADRLSREAFEPALWVISPSHPALAPERTPVLNSANEAVRARGRSGAVGGLRSLVDVLRTFRPDLVHCHGGRALKYAAASRLFWRARGYVYTKIGSIHPWLDHPLRRAFYRRLFEGLDAIVAVAEGLRVEMAQTFRPVHPRIVTIPTGIDAEPFLRVTAEEAAQTRTSLGVRPDEVALMAVGSLSWEKDPRPLLRLTAALAREGHQVRLLFAGSGPLEQGLRDEVERTGLDGHVRFLGVRDDVPRLLAAADIVLLSSLTEGLPAVLIEAGMAACPAVAFRVGAVEEVLVDGVTGFVVAPGDEAAFLQRLRRLIADPAMRVAFGEAARARCLAEFGVERYVARHEALFCELAQAAPAAWVGAEAVTPSPAAGERVPR